MATVADITNTPRSGLNHIDALLDTGPDWNYLTGANNTILYTFSVTSGNEDGRSGQEAFTMAQQVATRAAFDYISRITGIKFTETAVGEAAQIHLCNIDIESANTIGLCSWTSRAYRGANDVLTHYEANAYVYLDNVEWRAKNRDLTPGGVGYQTLLHELGHALGLKHPFEGDPTLLWYQDNSINTIMSYNNTGAPRSEFGEYDIAALNWLYGRDGLGGALGINSTTGGRYITGVSDPEVLTGTPYDDTLQGNAGNDTINGGEGTDTAVYRGAFSTYTITSLGNGRVQVSSVLDHTDTLTSIEILRFSDATYRVSDLLGGTIKRGGPGNDVFQAGAGNDVIDGMGGLDTVNYGGARANYTVAKHGSGYQVTDKVGNGGQDTLTGVERLAFGDGAIALDVEGVAGQAYRLYRAAFDRPADDAGLGYWIWRMDNGTSLQQVALEFTRQIEFATLYGSNPSDAEFIGFLYKNVLHREPEGAGFDYWMDAIQKVSRDQVLTFFSESDENQAQVIGSIGNGMTFDPWHG